MAWMVMENEMDSSPMGNDDARNDDQAELAQLRKIADAAEQACGLLWMVDFSCRDGKVLSAFQVLRDALGGPGSKGLGRAIQKAIDAGHEASHPPGATWWAGKKEPE